MQQNLKFTLLCLSVGVPPAFLERVAEMLKVSGVGAVAPGVGAVAPGAGAVAARG